MYLFLLDYIGLFFLDRLDYVAFFLEDLDYVAVHVTCLFMMVCSKRFPRPKRCYDLAQPGQTLLVG
jgi:hypothetical protein